MFLSHEGLGDVWTEKPILGTRKVLTLHLDNLKLMDTLIAPQAPPGVIPDQSQEYFLSKTSMTKTQPNPTQPVPQISLGLGDMWLFLSSDIFSP